MVEKVNVDPFTNDFVNGKKSTEEHFNELVYNVLDIMNSKKLKKKTIEILSDKRDTLIKLVIKKDGALVIEIGASGNNISYTIPEIVVTSAKEIIILNDKTSIKYIYILSKIVESL